MPEPSAVARAASPVTAGGWRAYESWLADGQGPAAAKAVDAAIRSSFGVSTKDDPDATLARGLIGVTRDHRTRQLVAVVDPAKVNLKALAAAGNARLRAAGVGGASGIGLRVQAGCRSSEQLLAAMRTLRARTWAPAATQASYIFDVDPKTSTVQVTFNRAAAPVANALKARLGDAVRISYGNPGRTGRLNDADPHRGGAAIGYYNSPICTSSFAIFPPLGQPDRAIVTAGHCFPNGVGVWSGTVRYGTSGGKKDYPKFDMMWVTSWQMSYLPKIYTDPCCPNQRGVTTFDNPVVGDFVCTSGAVTKAACGAEVTSLSVSLCDQDGCTLDLFRAFKSGGGTISQGGDSGGPIYGRPGADTAKARGIIIGGASSSEVVAEKIRTIQTHLNASLILDI